MNDPAAKIIDQIVHRMMQEHPIPGVVVGVTRNGAITHARGYGVMNLETRQPVTADTLFHQASVTKLFVGTALLQLAETGKLDLDAPVVRSLPYFRLADPDVAFALDLIGTSRPQSSLGARTCQL